jgi:hypothetical protein
MKHGKGWKRESGRHKLSRNGVKTKYSVGRGGRKLWHQKLHSVYNGFEEFEAYDEMYGLHERLGYETAEEAWLDNPVIQGSTDPRDYGKAVKQ